MGVYKKLKLKIKEAFNSQEAFAEAMDMSYPTLNLKLNGKSDWKTAEFVKACELLGIPLNESHLYYPES